MEDKQLIKIDLSKNTSNLPTEDFITKVLEERGEHEALAKFKETNRKMMTTGSNTDRYFSEETKQAIVFEHKNLTESQVKQIDYMKYVAGNLFDFIRSTKDDSNKRTTALALTNLEIAVMFATKAITQQDEDRDNGVNDNE